ncbi:MAG: cupin domain-containing protein [Brevefilum sp.]
MKFQIKNLVSGQASADQISIFEEITKPGFGPPLHNHHDQMEVFHILKGKHLFHLDGREIIANPGDCVMIPSGMSHTFKNDDTDDGLIHFELIPSGSSEAFFDRLVNDFEGIEDMGKFFKEHGLDLLGPPI